MRRSDTPEVRRAKRSLTRAMARARDVSRKWNRRSGLESFNEVRCFVEQDDASAMVRAAVQALRALGVEPGVDDRLHRDKFTTLPGYAERMLSEARRRHMVR